MKALIVIMVICFWIMLALAIPSTKYDWIIYIIQLLGSWSSCWVLLSFWDKLKAVK